MKELKDLSISDLWALYKLSESSDYTALFFNANSDSRRDKNYKLYKELKDRINNIKFD